jgi:hypothetical protein
MRLCSQLRKRREERSRELVDSQVIDEGQDGALGHNIQPLYTEYYTAYESWRVTYPNSTASRTIKETALRAQYTRVEQ